MCMCVCTYTNSLSLSGVHHWCQIIRILITLIIRITLITFRLKERSSCVSSRWRTCSTTVYRAESTQASRARIKLPPCVLSSCSLSRMSNKVCGRAERGRVIRDNLLFGLLGLPWFPSFLSHHNSGHSNPDIPTNPENPDNSVGLGEEVAISYDQHGNYELLHSY